jgi:hypothetical protein
MLTVQSSQRGKTLRNAMGWGSIHQGAWWWMPQWRFRIMAMRCYADHIFSAIIMVHMDLSKAQRAVWGKSFISLLPWFWVAEGGDVHSKATARLAAKKVFSTKIMSARR